MTFWDFDLAECGCWAEMVAPEAPKLNKRTREVVSTAMEDWRITTK